MNWIILLTLVCFSLCVGYIIGFVQGHAAATYHDNRLVGGSRQH